jgi:hypothetical protein
LTGALEGWVVIDNWVAGFPPADVPVALNVTGDPLRPAAVAVKVFVPMLPPSVHEVNDATPEALEVTVAGLELPPPTVTANVTTVPLTGFPLASVMSTLGGVATLVDTTALWLVTELAAIVAAAPAAVTVTVVLVALRMPEAENRRVRAPVAPVRVRLVKVATPLPSVVAVAGINVVASPLCTVTVTTTPDWLTGLFRLSRS